MKFATPNTKKIEKSSIPTMGINRLSCILLFEADENTFNGTVICIQKCLKYFSTYFTVQNISTIGSIIRYIE